MVYDREKFDEVIESENPDFRIRNKYHQDFFGVEIIDLYYSESTARLKNIPQYFDEIINDKHYRHKMDISDLAVHQFTLQSDGKPDRQIEGILQELPPISNYIQAIADKIRDKDARIQDYRKGLTHVNLIIYDTGGRLVTLPRSDFYRIFYIPNFKASLVKSEFREIYFITSIENGKWVYYPLKMVYLVSELCMFDGVLGTFYRNLKIGSPKEELNDFAQYLYHIGVKEIYISDMPNEYELIYGNCGIIITDEKRVIIRDYGDYPLPQNIQLYCGGDTSQLIDKNFERNIKTFTDNNTFSTELAFDVKCAN